MTVQHQQLATECNSSAPLYNNTEDGCFNSDSIPDRVTLLPIDQGAPQPGTRTRIMWGQDVLADVIDGRYKAVVCGINAIDNSNGIIAQIVSLLNTSQWSAKSITSYAKSFQDSLKPHAANDREPYILKFDLDSVLVMAVLRPCDRDSFTLGDLSRGFQTVTNMLNGRPDRRPVCSVSFLDATSNPLVVNDTNQKEPSFESVLQTMHDAGFRGDVYPSLQMWEHAHAGVFPSFPYPKETMDRIRSENHE